MASPGQLDPPEDTRKQEDTGAHQLADQSDSEDHFTDAQSAASAHGGSPVPTTRVERVDDEPAHGEVPGTEANKMREADAQPDEIAVIPEDDTESQSTGHNEKLPATVVEEAPGSMGPRSQEFVGKRQADAPPDVVVSPSAEEKGEVDGQSNPDEPNSPSLRAPDSESTPTCPPRRKSSRSIRSTLDEASDFSDDAEDAFGDDFDDFEEGAGDDDFDDFDDDFQQPDPQPHPVPAAPQNSLPFAIPDFEGLNADDIMSSTESYLAYLFPPEELDLPEFPPLPKESTSFTTPRSASLWSQLIAPPPLAPPDWIRSRTRRLFLVSLGVPVDLDEILPASKQKKLVLPSLSVPSGASPRTSSDSRYTRETKEAERPTSTA
ncbi:uncharacterized protein J7T54_008227 [Emericellopsis cladophorae]|uniref:Uncharacterized protein n=1 Tax=Emericellopsis cladophorae TaxID=2686198 RepID=A0A9P9XYD6_9HYPO|nr:uncharacterized protein J7T54_008227 [Emericellopsis cladophorae]KAI6779609.1 hypothetical protein J7T54_008227 [Emericellopsis cladophorae]